MGFALENNCPSVAESFPSSGLGGTSPAVPGEPRCPCGGPGGPLHTAALEAAALAREGPDHGEAVGGKSPARRQLLDSQGWGRG